MIRTADIFEVRLDGSVTTDLLMVTVIRACAVSNVLVDDGSGHMNMTSLRVKLDDTATLVPFTLSPGTHRIQFLDTQFSGIGLQLIGAGLDGISNVAFAADDPRLNSLISRVSALETPPFPLKIAVTNPTGSGAVTTLTLSIASRVGIPVVSAGRRMGRIWFSQAQWGASGTLSMNDGNLNVSCTTGTVVEGNGPTNINVTNLGIRHVAFNNGSAVLTLTASAPSTTFGTAYIQAEVDGIVISQQFSYNNGHV